MYMTPATIRKRFFSVLETAEKNIHLYVNTPGSDMTRHRLCPFSDTVKATLCLTMNRTNTELFNFFMSQNKGMFRFLIFQIVDLCILTECKMKFRDFLSYLRFDAK